MLGFFNMQQLLYYDPFMDYNVDRPVRKDVIGPLYKNLMKKSNLIVEDHFHQQGSIIINSYSNLFFMDIL